MAITVISIPWLRAPSRTRNGNRPLPAMSPHPEAFRVVDMERRSSNLLHDAALGGLDELDELDHIGGRGKLLTHFGKRLRSVQLRTQQQSESALQRFAPFFVKALALESDGVDAKTPGFALGDHARKRRDVLRNHCASADIRVAAYATKLVNRRQRPDRGVVLNRHVSG